MSGGSFDYAYCRVDDFACKLETILELQGKPNDYGGNYETYSPEVQAEMRRILVDAKRLAFEMREVEWRVSGDTGDESFIRRLKESNR